MWFGSGGRCAHGVELDGDIGDDADGGLHRPIDSGSSRAEDAERPASRSGKETELPRGRHRNLGGELTLAIEQPHIGGADRLATTSDNALHDGLRRDIDTFEARPAGDCAAHQASPGSSPTATGT